MVKKREVPCPYGMNHSRDAPATGAGAIPAPTECSGCVELRGQVHLLTWLLGQVPGGVDYVKSEIERLNQLRNKEKENGKGNEAR